MCFVRGLPVKTGDDISRYCLSISHPEQMIISYYIRWVTGDGTARGEEKKKALCVIVWCLLSLTEKINEVIISIERFYIQVTSRSQRSEGLPFFFCNCNCKCRR